jgi:DNA processing protein
LLAAEPPAVAIVGTRNASSYGLRVARAIADSCARAGVSVVSGLARGIAGAAHDAALSAGGRTVAVLGTGTDVHYPRSHRALQESIAANGLLLSELPPGTQGHSSTFPRRNRLIAALADITVVVEAGEGSGALITADCALELGRTVACVPNAIDVPSASGSNMLLKQHAEPVLAPDDVLALLNLRAQPTPSPVLDADAASVWSAIVAGIVDFPTIAIQTRLP